jgi:hypothetical protein
MGKTRHLLKFWRVRAARSGNVYLVLGIAAQLRGAKNTPT